MALIATEEKKNNTATAAPTTQQVETPTTAPESKPTTTPAATTQAQNKTTYNNSMQALKTTEYTAPTFSSDYDEQIADIYDKIVNREAFKYDYASDPLYGVYKDQYVQGGKQAMKDTMGQTAALTGGYGNSYGQAVGQQQYDAYLQRLNDVLPTLYGQAYDVYAAEGDQLQREFALAGAMRDTEYQQFRDEVGDKQYADAWALQQAESRGQYGDFGGFEELYGKDAAKKMKMVWSATNPVAAYELGYIGPEQFFAFTGMYPAGYEGEVVGGGEVNYYNLGGNQDVIAAQKELYRQGYNISVDGVWGPETAAAASAATGGTVTKLEDLY